MKLRPLNDYALIQPAPEEEKTPGGLFIPSVAREKSQTGEVIAIGPGHTRIKRDRNGKITEKTYVKTVVKPGERVFFEKYGGTKVDIEGREFVLIREENILGYVG